MGSEMCIRDSLYLHGQCTRRLRIQCTGMFTGHTTAAMRHRDADHHGNRPAGEQQPAGSEHGYSDHASEYTCNLKYACQRCSRQCRWHSEPGNGSDRTRHGPEPGHTGNPDGEPGHGRGHLYAGIHLHGSSDLQLHGMRQQHPDTVMCNGYPADHHSAHGKHEHNRCSG